MKSLFGFGKELDTSMSAFGNDEYDFFQPFDLKIKSCGVGGEEN